MKKRFAARTMWCRPWAGAGTGGGHLVAAGTPEVSCSNSNKPDRALSFGAAGNTVAAQAASTITRLWSCAAQSEHNLQNIDVSFPIGLMTVVTGVSGSGKSTLVNEILYKALAKKSIARSMSPERTRRLKAWNDRQGHRNRPVPDRPDAPVKSGNLHRSFYTDSELYAMLPESRARGYKAGGSASNVKGRSM